MYKIMDITHLLKEHERKDTEQFSKIEKRFDDQDIILIEIKSFMKNLENLQGLNNTFKAVDLLKKPALWLLAFTVGLVSFMGAIKYISAGLIIILKDLLLLK